MNTLLRIQALSARYQKGGETFLALDNVDLEIYEGEVLGIAGESGSGKSTFALGVMGLLPILGAQVSGSIRYEGTVITELSEKDLRKLRGREISLISQNPWSTLDPLFSIESQFREYIKSHLALSKPKTAELIRQALSDSQLPNDEKFMNLYPHQLSGGMLQRVAIAMATALSPRVLIADEPTSSLDVTTQAEIVRFMKDLWSRNKMTIVFISHDLALLSQICQRIAIIRNGRIIEIGNVKDLFQSPQQGYTQKLIESIPRVQF